MRLSAVRQIPFAPWVLSVLGLFIAITAVRSYAYFHEDEIWQVQEFALFKLGLKPESALAWEYHAAIRPWLQPAVYALAGRVAMLLGARNPYTLALVWRALTGVLSFGAILLFLETSLAWARTTGERAAHLLTATLTGFLPYLAVRTSSETFAAASFTAGLALLVRGEDPSGRRTNALSSARLLFVGLLMGVSFECRFQSAFLLAGVFLWMSFVRRSGVRELFLWTVGVAVALLIGFVVNTWGYERAVVTPLRYFRVNVLDYVANSFGTMPVYAYFYAEIANLFAPVVLVLLFAMLLAWYRHPRHVVTWVTAPFFVIHSLIAHKEERFLFPIAILATAFPLLAIGRGSSRGEAVAARLRRSVKRPWVLAVLAFASAAPACLLALYPVGWHHHFAFDRYVHESALGSDANLHAYALSEPDPGPPPYGSTRYDLVVIDARTLATRVADGVAKGYVVTDSPRMRTGEPLLDSNVELVYTEAPLWGIPWLGAKLLDLDEWYNQWQLPPLRPIRFRSLYRLR